MVIADCVATGVLTIVGDLSTYNGAYVLVVIFLYTLDLYADFTGGIDITIGIAQSLGIKVAENFDHPYFSKSLKEYWRRWHITMCEWFRIYVFYLFYNMVCYRYMAWCKLEFHTVGIIKLDYSYGIRGIRTTL